MAEKQEIAQLEAAPEAPSPLNGYHVDPEVEKRLVRKLDRKLIPWVMLLCKKSAISDLQSSADDRRPSIISRPIKYWVRQIFVTPKLRYPTTWLFLVLMRQQ
jgi:hypothetical protein